MTAVASKDFGFSLAPGSKIASVADTSSGVDHGTPIEINIKSIGAIDSQYFSEELRHDGRVADKYTEFDKISSSFVLSNIDLEALALVTGNTVETTGNNKRLDFNANNMPGYFAFAFRSLYNPTGALAQKVFYLHKCKVTGVSQAAGDRTYSDITVNFEAIPRLYDGKYKGIEFLDAAAAITFTDLPV